MGIEELRRREVAKLDEAAAIVKKHLASGEYNGDYRTLRHARGVLNRIAAQRYRLTGKRAELDGTQEEGDI